MGKLQRGKKTEFKRHLDPEELRPRKERPPDSLIAAASRDLPGVLSDMVTFPEEDNVSRLVSALKTRGHLRTVCKWALYEHVKAGRIKVELRTYTTHYLVNDEGGAIEVSTLNEDTIENEEEYQVLCPTPELNTWWEQIVSDGETSQHDLNSITLEKAAKLLGMTKKTLANRRSDKSAKSLCPAPAVKGKGRSPDIWNYEALRPWLVENWPDNESMLPEDYKDVRKRLSDL